jgi:hypothetical protein
VYAEYTVFWENWIPVLAWPTTEVVEAVGNPQPVDPNGEKFACSRSNAVQFAMSNAVFDVDWVIVGNPKEIDESWAAAIGVKTNAAIASNIKKRLNVTLCIHYPPPKKCRTSVD